MRCAGRCVDESRHSRPLRTLATYCGLPHPNSICAQDGGGGYGGMFGDEAYFRRAPESARACAHSHQEVARELLRVGRRLAQDAVNDAADAVVLADALFRGPPALCDQQEQPKRESRLALVAVCRNEVQNRPHAARLRQCVRPRGDERARARRPPSRALRVPARTASGIARRATRRRRSRSRSGAPRWGCRRRTRFSLPSRCAGRRAAPTRPRNARAARGPRGARGCASAEASTRRPIRARAPPSREERAPPATRGSFRPKLLQ